MRLAWAAICSLRLQLVCLRRGEKRIVRHRVPKHVRELGRHLPAGERHHVAFDRSLFAKLGAVEERRRLQHGLDDDFDAVFESPEVGVGDRPVEHGLEPLRARSATSGRRNARLPKSWMNEEAQPSLPSRSGSQLGISAPMLPTARALTSSATFMYCSISKSLLVSAAAWLLKPATSSSGGSRSAGLLVSPSRSRTVRLYSNRVRRRIGVSTTQRLLATLSSMALAPSPPIEPVQPASKAAASSRKNLVPWGWQSGCSFSWSLPSYSLKGRYAHSVIRA